MTFVELWMKYQPVSERDNDSWKTERSRAEHLVRHLGMADVRQLSLADVDAYRAKRLKERTHRGTTPSPATLDREVELLKRVVNYAVACRLLGSNPLLGVKLLGRPNVRRSVVDPQTFERLLDAARPHLRPLLVAAYDTGCRLGELLDLTWDRVDLEEGCVRLAPQDTKTEQARTVYLTERAKAVLVALAGEGHPRYVFASPRTGGRLVDVRRAFRTAAAAIGRPELWFHDLRRSFVTRARRQGIPESVVMRMSGHRTASVFKRYNIVDDSDVKNAARKLS